MKGVLWRVVKRLSYIEDARCQKLKRYIAKYMCGSVVFQTIHFDTSIISVLLLCPSP